MQARKVAQQNDFLSTQLQGAQMARAQGQANINAGLTGAAGTLGALAVQYDKTRPLYDKQKEVPPNKLGAPQPVSNPEKLLNQSPAVDLPQPKINAKYWENAQYNPLAQFQINPNIGQSVSPYQMNPNISKSISPFQSFTNPVDNF